MKKACSVEGCDSPVDARGFCKKHYARFMRHGDTSIVKKRVSVDVEKRFWSHIEKDETSGCWLFRGAASYGYGSFHDTRGGKEKRTQAHRFSYEIHNGPIPDGYIVRHKCRNRACVNPEHLELGTYLENNSIDKMRDGTILFGEDNPSSILTESDVVEIKQSSERVVDLADRFGVGVRTVYDVLQGKTWNHVEA